MGDYSGINSEDYQVAMEEDRPPNRVNKDVAPELKALGVMKKKSFTGGDIKIKK